MTSLVTEVLVQAGKLDKDDIRTKVMKLSSLSTELKSKISTFVRQKYGEFNPMFLSCESVLKDITIQQQQAKNIQATLSDVVKVQLKDSTSEFERLSKEHEETVALLAAMEDICEIAELFTAFEESTNTENFQDSALALMKIQAILDGIRDSPLHDVDVNKFLQLHYTFHLEGLRYNLDEEWRNAISWVVPTSGQSETEVVLKIPHFDSNQAYKEKMQNLVSACSILNCLDRKVQKFADSTMQHLIKPVIHSVNLEPEFDCDEMATSHPPSLRITLTAPKNNSIQKVADDESARPTVLFQKVVSLLKHLYSNFLCLATDKKSGRTMMTIFGDHVREELLDILVKKCLVPTVPQSKEELNNYSEVVDAVRRFEGTLCEIDFIPNSADSSQPGSKLTEYVANVSYHFSNRRCTDILKQARAMMKKEMLNTVQIGEKDGKVFDVPSTLLAGKSSQLMEMPVGTEFDSQKPSKLISENTLQLPNCQVSQCAVDLVQLAQRTLREAAQSDMFTSVQLVNTAHDIFDLFYCVVPTYHKESLENIPQLTAVFHNDCMYIGHHLLFLGHQFSSLNSTASKLGKVLTFVDQVPRIRRLGAEALLHQMERQNAQILECLEPIRTFSMTVASDKYSSAEKAVRQVLHLLNHLKTVWAEVLPNNVLLRAIGTLVNSCVTELVKIICSMEDISADDSVSLKLVCLLLLDHVPALFRKDSDRERNLASGDITWQKHVHRWPRLQELVFLLSAGLNDIVDRWSEGKGPLASAFSITEVKSLMRALFQNTEHRAQAILKIRI